MKNKIFALVLVVAMSISIVGCGNSKEAEQAVSETTESTVENEPAAEAEVEEPAEEPAETETNQASLGLEDGVYSVDFTTDSGMFHVNEMMDGKGTLTVENGVGTVHITLISKNILNLYLGLAANAEADAENQLQPTNDSVTYEDGTTEEVYGFDVPVAVIDEEFDLALVGTKGTWYDHKVKVSNPEAISEE